MFWAQEYILALCQTFSCYVFVPLKNKHTVSATICREEKNILLPPHISNIYKEQITYQNHWQSYIFLCNCYLHQ